MIEFAQLISPQSQDRIYRDCTVDKRHCYFLYFFFAYVVLSEYCKSQLNKILDSVKDMEITGYVRRPLKDPIPTRDFIFMKDIKNKKVIDIIDSAYIRLFIGDLIDLFQYNAYLIDNSVYIDIRIIDNIYYDSYETGGDVTYYFSIVDSCGANISKAKDLSTLLKNSTGDVDQYINTVLDYGLTHIDDLFKNSGVRYGVDLRISPMESVKFIRNRFLTLFMLIMDIYDSFVPVFSHFNLHSPTNEYSHSFTLFSSEDITLADLIKKIDIYGLAMYKGKFMAFISNYVNYYSVKD